MQLLTFANRLLRGLMVATIGLMAVLVFINVVLRYGFNSNLGVTEEVARYLFVWLTFLGAISAFIKNTHVRVDTFLNRMTPGVRRAVQVLSDIGMLICCAMIFTGCWQLTLLNMQNYLPISGIPVGVMYFAGVPASLCIGVILLVRIYRRLFRAAEGEQA